MASHTTFMTLAITVSIMFHYKSRIVIVHL